MKMKQLNLKNIYENNPYMMKVFKYKRENKEQIRVPSEHPNWKYDVYENTGNQTKSGKWIYAYAGSTGLVNEYDTND